PILYRVPAPGPAFAAQEVRPRALAPRLLTGTGGRPGPARRRPGVTRESPPHPNAVRQSTGRAPRRAVSSRVLPESAAVAPCCLPEPSRALSEERNSGDREPGGLTGQGGHGVLRGRSEERRVGKAWDAQE